MANEKEKKQRTPQEQEALRRKKEEQARRARRRNRQIIGLVLSILIIWGAVSIVQSAVQLARDLTDDREERLEYQERIQLLVSFDVLPFESVSQLDDEVLKQVAIWGVYLEQGDTLQRSEFDEPLVPTLEVDRWAQRMFGPTFQFGEPHGEFAEAAWGLAYVIDEETGAYVLPATSIQYNYLPSVVAIERMSGGYRRVVVGYVSTVSDTGSLFAEPDYDHPARYMDFIFRRDGSEYYLDRLERNTTWEVTTAADDAAASEAVVDALPGEEGEAAAPPVDDENDILPGGDEVPGMDEAGVPDDGEQPAEENGEDDPESDGGEEQEEE